jgi:hypothetical protein
MKDPRSKKTTVSLPQQKQNQEASEEFSGQFPRYGHTAESEAIKRNINEHPEMLH